MTDSPQRLRRTLRFWQVTASGVGIVIGAGIYVLVGEAAREAGPAVWLSFVLAGVLAGLTALSYAELAGMFPSAGAEYEFARRAFNGFTGFLTGWLMVTALLIAAAAVSIGFAQYLGHFADIDTRVGAIGLLCALTLLIIAGMERSIWLTVTLVLFQVGGLLLVTISGVHHVGDRPLLAGSDTTGVLAGAALVFFAFIGFDEVVTLSEETYDARHVVPRALLAALGIATLLYVLVGIAAVSLVDAGDLAASERPLALALEHDWEGRGADIVAAIALAATTNTTLLALTAASRNAFAMARGGSLPAVLSRVWGRTAAPWVAALGGLAVAVIFALPGEIELAASVTDAAVYAIFIVVNAAVIVLRFRAPDAERAFVVPLRVGRVPVLPLAAMATVILMSLSLDWIAWPLAAATLAPALVYWRFRPSPKRD